MKLTDIIIDNKKYEYVNKLIYNDKLYIAYMDDNSVYISEITYENDEVFFNPVNEELLPILKREFKL